MESNIESLIKQLLIELGENPDRPGLMETPKRVSRLYKELLDGSSVNLEEVIKTFPSENVNQLIVVKNISFYSICEHHMVPFFGSVDVGYIPRDRIIGLSKFPRIINIFASRLQTQERLNHQILESIVKFLNPKGCAVRLRATHLCMSMRGVKNTTAETVTLELDGVLKKDKTEMQKFLNEVD